MIWPDYDYDHAGQQAAQKLQDILTQLNRAAGKEGRVGIVDLLNHLPNPQFLPDKWDLADQLPEGWDIETVHGYLKEAIGEEPQKTPMAKNNAEKGENQEGKNDSQREEFEASRLPFHQEWCATFGFMEHAKRFPENAEELNATYWQGERLTAIEGRLYKEIIDRGGRVNDKKLMLQARKELSKNQTIPDPILTLGKAFDLTLKQLEHFIQHVLIHRDRTNQFPEPSELETICRAIKTHHQVMQTQDTRTQTTVSGKGNLSSDKSDPTTAPDSNLPQKSHEHHQPTGAYRVLIEQQAVLAHLKREPQNPSDALKIHKIEASCVPRLKRLDEKIHTIEKLSQDMKERDLNRQTQNGA